MGLFSPFVYKNKKGDKFWLHSKQRSKVTIYYFSRERKGALWNLPKGYEVFENPITGFPFLRKKKKKSILPISIFKKS
jgi:hypothetical protein